MKKSILIVFITLLSVLFSVNTVSASLLNVCNDSSITRFVSPDMPLDSAAYSPSLVMIKKGKYDNGLNFTKDTKMRKEAYNALSLLGKSYKGKFKKYLTIKSAYVGSNELDKREKSCSFKNFLLCPGKGKSDLQLGLSFSLAYASSEQGKEKINTQKEGKWIKKAAIQLGLIEIFQGKGKNEPTFDYYFRYVGKKVSSTLNANDLSFYQYIKEQSSVDETIKKCFKDLSTPIQSKTILQSSSNGSNAGLKGVNFGKTNNGGEDNQGNNTGLPLPGEEVKSITEFKTSGFDPVNGVFPGTFDGSYKKIKKDILKVLRVNLVVSDSMLQMGHNFETQNSGPFAEILLEAIEYAKKGTNARSPEIAAEAVKHLQSPLAKDFVVKLLPAISLREHGGNIKINPNGNVQGLFQHYVIEKFLDGRANYNTSGKMYYSKRERLPIIYQKGKVLKKDEMLEQFINIVISITTDNRYINHQKQLYDNNNKAYSYDANLNYMIKGLNSDLGLSDSEIVSLKAGLISKNMKEVNTVYAKHKEGFMKYGILEAEELLDWLDYIYAGGIWTKYNGAGNNGYYRFVQRRVVRFVLDHAYVSNTRKYGICFVQCAVDGCAYTNTSFNDGAIFDLIKANNVDYERKQASYATMLTKWSQNKTMLATTRCK